MCACACSARGCCAGNFLREMRSLLSLFFSLLRVEFLETRGGNNTVFMFRVFCVTLNSMVKHLLEEKETHTHTHTRTALFSLYTHTHTHVRAQQVATDDDERRRRRRSSSSRSRGKRLKEKMSGSFIIPSQMEAQFDAFFMNVAQQCAQLSSSQHDVSAIDVMHEAYFGFLRRKTDFFSNNSNDDDDGKNGFESRGKKSVLTALQKQLEEVEKHKTQREKDEDEARRKRQKDLEKKRAKEEEMKVKAMEEERERKERVREALMKQKMEESKKKIVELDDDGNEVNEEEDEDKDEAAARENKEKVEKDLKGEEDDPHALQPGTVHPSALNGGEAEHYVWSQTLQEVDVRLPVPVGTRAKDIVCEFTATTFKFGLKSEPQLRIPEKSKLCEAIKPDDSFWTLEDNREVRLTLTKSNQMSWWENVIKGDPRIDTKKVVPENSNLSDLDGETRSTVEKMMYDQRQKAAGKPTSDQENKMGLMKKFMEAHPEMDFSNCKFDDGMMPQMGSFGQ